MDMIPVESSHIARIGYSVDTATLRIEFLSGNIYEYYDVPQNVFDEFLSADSKGKYANRNIYKVYSQQKIQ